MNTLLHLALALAMVAPAAGPTPARGTDEPKPTVVLVHGAFAESSSWDGVIERLQAAGYPVVAASNPLRGVGRDAASVEAVVRSLDGPVVLVGHSYGGSVITEAGAGPTNVKALVYVAAFAPDARETSLELSLRFPGSTLGGALLPPVVLPDGTADLYIDRSKFWRQFAADLPADAAAIMAATQRPIAQSALNEPASASAWKTLPSYFVYGDADLNIPAEAHAFMARRARSRRTVVLPGGSHVVMTSRPDAVVDLIVEAAAAR